MGTNCSRSEGKYRVGQQYLPPFRCIAMEREGGKYSWPTLYFARNSSPEQSPSEIPQFQPRPPQGVGQPF